MKNLIDGKQQKLQNGINSILKVPDEDTAQLITQLRKSEMQTLTTTITQKKKLQNKKAIVLPNKQERPMFLKH